MIRADGGSYVHGPLAVIGATDDAWYRLPPEQASLFTPLIGPDILGGGSPDFSRFSPGAVEQQGGQSCRRYTGERDATTGLLQSIAASGLPIDADPSRIESADSAVLICDDGYLYALDLSFVGKTPGDQPTPYSYDLRLRLSGFDQTLVIDPPAGARDLPASPTP
ncbi:MAG: hypothetical protein HGA45_43235 [Chloroflexales bacterium]|nr:hypothetical protein [Chloroflexales bacterium]